MPWSLVMFLCVCVCAAHTDLEIVFIYFSTAHPKPDTTPSPQVPRQLSLEQQIKRKDEIIQTRNIQIANIWQELHTRQPWRNALDVPARIAFDSSDEVRCLTANNAPGAISWHARTILDPLQVNATSRKLAFVAINTGIGSRRRRDVLRQTWVPHGELLATLEREKVCNHFQPCIVCDTGLRHLGNLHATACKVLAAA